MSQVGEVLQRVGIFPSFAELLDLDRLEALASWSCGGLSNFGRLSGDDEDDAGHRDSYVRFISEAASRRAGGMSLFGYFLARHILLTLLRQRLLLEEAFRRHPDIARQDVRQPTFIVGLPRTGSTLLHRLLALDRTNFRPLTVPEAFAPLEAGVALDGDGDGDGDGDDDECEGGRVGCWRRTSLWLREVEIRQGWWTRLQLSAFFALTGWVNPALMAAHPMHVDDTEECIFLHAIAGTPSFEEFESFSFSIFHIFQCV